MLFLSIILNTAEENCVNTFRALLSLLPVKVSKTGTRKIKEHSDYPSMLSLSDSLRDLKIDTIGLKVDSSKLLNLPIPFIAQIQKSYRERIFTVVRECDSKKVVLSKPATSGWETIPTEEFLKQYTGMVLLAEAEEKAAEKEYVNNKRKENWNSLVKVFAIALISLLCIGCVIHSYHVSGISAWAATAILILKIFGSYVGGLLLWYEIDSHNPNLQKVCQGTKNINCGAILKSNAAKIFAFSWSEIGFFYFAGGVITLLVERASPYSLSTVAWLNVIALPYIIFSIYYQWRVAKQWCVLCVTVQGVLLIEFLVAVAGGFYKILDVATISSGILPTSLCFILPALCWFILKPVIQLAKENDRNKNALSRLKYNTKIFDALLQKQKVIEHNTEGLGITIGSANAPIKIVKVCNPYCGPCASAHGVLEELLKNNDNISLQIIFTTKNIKEDIRTTVVKHIMAIAAKNDKMYTMQALNDWYLTSKRDYVFFADKYPMNGGIEEQVKKIEEMSEWCEKTKIGFTPTIFINGHQLPENYEVADLKYFLND